LLFCRIRKQPKEESSSIVELAYRDSLFFVDLEAASLKNVLNEMATLAHLNLAVYGELRENVYLKADSLPLNALLKMLFQGSRYTYTFDSLGTILVGERGAPSAIAANSLYYLEHIHSEKALLLLTKAYQDRGLRILEVKEQNALLLMGASTEIESASHFLKKIDVETLQVLLECIIVEFNKGKQFEFGFRSGSAKKTSEGGLGINSFIRISYKSRFWAVIGEKWLLSDQFDFERPLLKKIIKPKF
jgi:type IV pilus assembly protein PilQ